MNDSIIRSSKYLKFLFIGIFTIYALVLAKDFLYPLAIGILLSYLLYPLTNFLEKYGATRIMAILISIFVLIFIISITFVIIYRELAQLLDDLPAIKAQAEANVISIQHAISKLLGINDVHFEHYLKDALNGFFDPKRSSFVNVFSATTGTIFKIGIMPVYIFLFLYYRTKFANFVLALVPKDKKLTTIKILRDISTIVARYMGGVFIVVIILCIINSLGLLVIGMKYALMLGVISALFSFIPYFGNVIGGGVVIIFALVTQDDISIAFRLAVFYFLVHFLENNILSPNIVGFNVNLNPFIIIIGLIAAAMVWGIPGMLVAVPFMAILKIIINDIDNLKPYAFLMDTKGTRRHALTIENLRKLSSRWYTKVKKNLE